MHTAWAVLPLHLSMHMHNRRKEEKQVISSLLIESRAAVVGDDDWYAKSDWWMPGCGDGHERKAMKWTVPRKAGEAMMMGMFASGMQQAIVLQQKAKTARARQLLIDSAPSASSIARRRRRRRRHPSSWTRRPRRGRCASWLCWLSKKWRRRWRPARYFSPPTLHVSTVPMSRPLVHWLAPSCRIHSQRMRRRRWRCTGRRRGRR
jgi:hypothetical protein